MTIVAGEIGKMDMPEQAKMFWTASHLVRRAVDRDHTVALRVLRHLAGTATPNIARRASAALSEAEEGARGRG